LNLRVTVTVPAPLEQTWHYVAEQYLAHHSSWDRAITDMRLTTPGPLAAGARGEETRSFAGRQIAGFEITAMQPDERFSLRNTSGPFDLDRSYQFSVMTDTATRLTFTFRMRPHGAIRIMFPLLKPVIARQVRANISRIPQLVAATGCDQRRS
jgi:hypothetical protein